MTRRRLALLALPGCIAASACDAGADAESDSKAKALFPGLGSEGSFLSDVASVESQPLAEQIADASHSKGAFLRRTEQSNAEMFQTAANEPDLLLKPTNTHVCFLTRVSGNLGGQSTVIVHHSSTDTRARCLADADPTSENDVGPTWKINVCQKEENSLRAEATCVPGSNFVLDPGGLVAGSGLFDLKVIGDCSASLSRSMDIWPGLAVSFINGLKGRFDGGGESVEVARNNVSWTLPSKLWARTQTCGLLEGIAYSLFANIPDGGHATKAVSFSISAQRNESKTVKMIRTRDGVCYLTKLSGQFDGDPERIRIYPKKDSAGVEYWMVEAHADRGSAFARTECMYYDQTSGPIN
jgi:hypothetical protein